MSIIQSPSLTTSSILCAAPNLVLTRSFKKSSFHHHAYFSVRSCNIRHLQTCHIQSLPINSQGYVEGGPKDPQPDYSTIDAEPLNQLIYSLFRAKMAQALGNNDSKLQGYPAIIDLTRKLNSIGSSRDTQVITRRILQSLFPSWLPPAFKVIFSKPLPRLSCKLNAFATWATCQWLMGECEINDVEIDGGVIGKGHGVLVKRCRYLEDAGCASICINSCKVPTQEFFMVDMGLPLTMTPNYETFECQFAFGASPPSLDEDPAFSTPCFTVCPTRSTRQAKSSSKTCHKITLTD